MLVTRAAASHVFSMRVSAPLQRERAFQELKKEHSSHLAWHGSPFRNWHNILRGSLKNMSGTTGQLHGASYGKGIYTAVQVSFKLRLCMMAAHPL